MEICLAPRRRGKYDIWTACPFHTFRGSWLAGVPKKCKRHVSQGVSESKAGGKFSTSREAHSPFLPRKARTRGETSELHSIYAVRCGSFSYMKAFSVKWNHDGQRSTVESEGGEADGYRGYVAGRRRREKTGTEEENATGGVIPSLRTL